jgi:DNA-binding NarL/FixJ family response regulator
MNSRPIRIVLVDDHTVVRESLALFLGRATDLELVGSVGDGHAALEVVATTRPDVVIVDLRLPGMDGITLIERLRVQTPATRVLVLTAHTGDEAIRAALRSGADAFILKSAPGDELLAAIRQIRGGRVRLSSEAALLLAASEGMASLSSRELEVLRLAADGCSNKRIGAELALSENTVKNHMKTILQKLHAEDRTGAVVTALRRGIIGLDDER